MHHKGQLNPLRVPGSLLSSQLNLLKGPGFVHHKGQLNPLMVPGSLLQASQLNLLKVQ